MGYNSSLTNLLENPKKDQRHINSEDFAISLLKKYGDTLYLFLNFEGITDDQIIGELLCKIVEKSCLKINSPEAYKAKPAIFSSAFQILKNVHLQYRDTLHSKVSSPLIATNPYLHTLSSVSFEKRYAYILKIKDKLTYRELETVLNIHRAEISKLLTETREQIRLNLSAKNILPFSQRALLCSLTYQYLSPYLDNELNILHTIDIQEHIKNCENCLKILADHQYIEKQFESLPSVPGEKLISIYLLALNSKNETLESQTQQKTPNTYESEVNNENREIFYDGLLKKALQFLKSLLVNKKRRR
ncbi:MAG: zf-HC2 domain-containing protein [Candidatus Hydrogenedentes bacterium]|nr:zf-HC2 domain-containing protein [Candidatus Hydrogenedentota bacterium]